MAVFLGARLMVRYADKYDPDLASAFEKLAGDAARGAPRPRRAEPRRPPGRAPRPGRSSTTSAQLTRAWAERRVVEINYEGAAFEGRAGERSRRTVRPFLIEPSLQTHALYLIGWDEDRGGDADVQDRAHPRGPGDASRASSRPRARRSSGTCAGAGTSSRTSPRPRSSCGSRPPSRIGSLETTWHPLQRTERTPDGGLVWRSTVSGVIEIRLWILSWGEDVEVLEPAELRDQGPEILRRAAGRYRVIRGVMPPRTAIRDESGRLVRTS